MKAMYETSEKMLPVSSDTLRHHNVYIMLCHNLHECFFFGDINNEQGVIERFGALRPICAVRTLGFNMFCFEETFK